ncbi:MULTISPECIES: hypothetical protein [unclassified Exiguobacterium]|uniref:hypothetical protein n=1 Tax=unclassified Exiguobacterium TaxID=2644629 RepID=UPI00103D1D05|nr:MULTISPECIES: hypothetical protein [unclassified Exiguobacterium]TCI42956.1 hypothetical protein EVJ31_13200 [Exiguobacterium sp. SH5S32]TCI49708.1 hypothetical protein EVJ25_13800 [Exiguobacterium sp. SH1S4]TCI67771.1 hypothetical protein EVJ23_13210 [Exiguobacterium sp. SH1S1]
MSKYGPYILVTFLFVVFLKDLLIFFNGSNLQWLNALILLLSALTLMIAIQVAKSIKKEN